MEARSTPPVCAWAVMSSMAPSVHTAEPASTWGQWVMARARVGHRSVQRWQFTHFMESARRAPVFSSR